MGIVGSVISGAASLGGSIASARAAMSEADKQRNYQTSMSNTAYRRAVKDMRAAGLNPLLAYKQGGASTPSGAMPAIPDFGKAASTAVEGFKAGNQGKLQKAQAAELAQRVSTGGALEQKAIADTALSKANAIQSMELAQNARQQRVLQNLHAEALGIDMAKRRATEAIYNDEFGPEMRAYKEVGVPGLMWMLGKRGISGARTLKTMLEDKVGPRPSWYSPKGGTLKRIEHLSARPRYGYTAEERGRREGREASRQYPGGYERRGRTVEDLFR